MEKIIVSKQKNYVYQIGSREYPTTITFKNKDEAAFFGLQLIRNAKKENHLKLVCCIAKITSDNVKEDSYIELTNLIDSLPENLAQNILLSRLYASDYSFNLLDSEDLDLVIAFSKIVTIIRDLFDSWILGNLDFGSNLFGTGSENIFYDMFKENFTDVLYDVNDMVKVI